jgi:hypothetical protein
LVNKVLTERQHHISNNGGRNTAANIRAHNPVQLLIWRGMPGTVALDMAALDMAALEAPATAALDMAALEAPATVALDMAALEAPATVALDTAALEVPDMVALQSARLQQLVVIDYSHNAANSL